MASSCWMCKALAHSKCEIISENWARVSCTRPSGGFPEARTHELYILRTHLSFAANNSQHLAELVRSVGTVHESAHPSFPAHFHAHGFGQESPPPGSYKTVACWTCELLSEEKCEIVSENWARVKRPKISRGFPGAKKHELFILRQHVPFSSRNSSRLVLELVRSVGTVHEAIHPSFSAHFHVHGFGKESPPAMSYKTQSGSWLSMRRIYRLVAGV